MKKLRLQANIENLERLIQYVSGFAREHGFLQKKIREIELATEEALVNIFNYAYPDKNDGNVEVRCQMDDYDNFAIDILDTGVPFDFKSLSGPDLDSAVHERPIGGLGVFLIQKMADDVRYRRDGEKNILTLTFQKNISKRSQSNSKTLI